MNKQVVRRQEGVMGEVRRAVVAMLEAPGDIHLSLARAADFAEVLVAVAERDEPLLIVLMSQAVAAAWAEELTRHGIAARALGPRDAPAKQPRVVVVGPQWLASADHCTWVQMNVKRVIVRGGDAPLLPVVTVPIISVEVAAEGAGWIPEGARREGIGFGRAQFSVRPIGAPAARKDYVEAWVAGGALQGPNLTYASGTLLQCGRAPRSFTQLARWIASVDAEQVTILFGPDDLLLLQLGVAQHVMPLLEQGAWPPPAPPRDTLALLEWLHGASCRTAFYAAAFGELIAPCGDCEACGRTQGLERFHERAVSGGPVAGVGVVNPASGESASRSELVAEDLALASEVAAEPAPVILSPDEAVAFEHLREWRKKRARAEDVPSYVVFGNATLVELARARPCDRDSFLAVKGCGEKKWDKFGAEVVSLICETAT